MQRTCTQCATGFEITDEDFVFYEKVSPVFNGKKEAIPPPTLCPVCRRRRRLAFRNERNLYHRKCDWTGKQIISQYADPALKVYVNSEWWSDGWDALAYGKEMDFSRSFFEQFRELQRSVPHLCVANDASNENSDYTNQTGFLKNCYLVFDSDYCEKSLYLQTGKYSISTVDGLRPFHCELCYECVDCLRCYKTFYSQNCENCSDSYFLKDCIGCKNCFGCVNQRNKEYCIFNEYVGPEKYKERIAEFNLSNHASLEHAKKTIGEWLLKNPTKPHHNIAAENSSGDFLNSVQNVRECFDCNDIRDCRYCTNLSEKAVDCMDYDVWGFNAELLYEVITSGYNPSRVLFSFDCWSNVHEMAYCDSCFNSSNLFGCVGLRKNEYCILNKQYSKEEYEKLVPKIIEHMRTTGEWGEFFPFNVSLFGYNETVAQEYYPLPKSDAVAIGANWHEEEETEKKYLGPAYEIPDDIADVDDGILSQILSCEDTGKPYKIIPQELQFYRDGGIPIPRACPERRHRKRMALRNPRTLYERACANCQKTIQTTYAPDHPEIVYCEECYLASVY